MRSRKGFTGIEMVVRLVVVGLILCMVLPLVGCTDNAPKADEMIQRRQEKAMQEGVAQTGLPAIHNFKEKKMLKMLYELRDKEDLICHAYLFNVMNGEVGQYLGKCIGYGLPASTQYSNPKKVIQTVAGRIGGVRNWYTGTLPQAEPNGLFMPEGLSATWLMMIDPETDEPRPVYVEPQIIVSPFKLK